MLRSNYVLLSKIMNDKAMPLIGIYYLCNLGLFKCNVFWYLKRYPEFKINIDLYGLYIWLLNKNLDTVILVK